MIELLLPIAGIVFFVLMLGLVLGVVRLNVPGETRPTDNHVTDNVVSLANEADAPSQEISGGSPIHKAA